MRTFFTILTFLLAGMGWKTSGAQDKPVEKNTPPDSSIISTDEGAHPSKNQKDLIDVMSGLISRHGMIQHDTMNEKATGRYHISVAPGIGYTLSTGFAAILAANAAFYTDDSPNAKLSNIFSDVVYTQKAQLIVHLQGNVWTKNNKYNIVTDWRYLKYPQRTYGLGGHTSLDRYVDQDYQYVRFYQTALRNIRNNLYAGVGYSLDYHWNISRTASDSTYASDINITGLPTKTLSAGLNFNVLYDNRSNSINPDRGAYLSVLYRPNFIFLGSNTHWESLRIDLRKYVRWPASSENVLAFWSFNWLTLTGNPPYLDLPSTGWDPFNNTGRGYIQGRFRGKNMVYMETEYRFKITHNGLLGGVVFANAQSFSEPVTNKFEAVWPAAGLGARLKVNKHSRTNIAVDYGFGAGGSRGFFVNLGEIF